MRRFTLLLFFLGVGFASGFSQKFSVKPKQAPKFKFQLVKPATGAITGKAMKQKASAKAPTIDVKGLIHEASGERMSYSFQCYYDMGFGTGTNGGMDIDVYYDESDKKVYIKNPICVYCDDFYACGELTSGNINNGVITFKNWIPTSIDSYDEVLYSVLLKPDKDGVYDVDTLAESFTYTIKDGVIESGENGLALMGKDGSAYVAQIGMQYVPMIESELKPIVVPDGAGSYYYHIDSRSESDGIVYRSGNDMYFTGLFEGVFKGELRNDSKIAIETPQYIGKVTDFYGYKYMYVNTCSLTDDGEYLAIDEPGTLLLDYDPVTGSITAPTDKYISYLAGNFELSSYAMPGTEWTLFEESEIPAVVPADAKMQLYAMNTEYDDQGNHQGSLLKLGIYQDSLLYIMRCNGENDNFVMKASVDKGKYDSTSSIVPFTLPVGTPVGLNENKLVKVYSGEPTIRQYEDYDDYTYTYLSYVVSDGTDKIDIEYDKETGKFKSNDVLLFSYASGGTQSYLIYPEYSPVTNVVELRKGDSKMLVYSDSIGIADATMCNLAESGDSLWITLPKTLYLSETTILGKRDGDKFIVNIPQLVSNDNAGYFLRNGKTEQKETESNEIDHYYWKEWVDCDKTTLACDYDEATGMITFPEGTAIIGLNKVTEDYYSEEPLKDLGGYKAVPYVEGLKTPATPYELTLDDPSEDYWGNGTRWCLSAYIPNLDVEGGYLDYDSLTYRLYFDETPFVFDPYTYYPDFAEETIDVPFNNEASGNIPHPYWSDHARMVYLNSIPNSRIGVQSTYHFKGQTADSEIAWLDVSGLNSIRAAKTADKVGVVEWFDLSGRRLAKPVAGLNIKRTHYADGTVKSEKAVVK